MSGLMKLKTRATIKSKQKLDILNNLMTILLFQLKQKNLHYKRKKQWNICDNDIYLNRAESLFMKIEISLTKMFFLFINLLLSLRYFLAALIQCHLCFYMSFYCKE